MWKKLHPTANILLSCLVFSFIGRADTISCFQCNSIRDRGCAELEQNDVDSPYLSPCDESSLERQPVFCRKVHLKVKMKFLAGGIHERVIRSCGWKEHTKKNRKDCYQKQDIDHEEIVCQCFNDRCNVTSHVYAIPLMTLLATFLMLFFS